MKTAHLVCLVAIAAISLGCNAVVGGAVGGAIVAEEAKKDLEQAKIQGKVVGEIQPDETVVKLWLCNAGSFVFGNESCIGYTESRDEIQEVIRIRYPHYTITKIERSKEGIYDVFFVHLKNDQS